MIWFVKSYTDSSCGSFLEGSKSTFSCDNDPSKAPAKCTQKSAEIWEKGAWKQRKMVDYAGYPNSLVISYFLKIESPRKAVLKSRSISDDGEVETERLSL